MGTLLYFLIFAGLFALMMRFGCGSHVMGHRGQHSGAHGGERPETGAKATDPVCGMTVDTATAKTAVHAGQTYYFCSESCLGKFEASPQKYVQAAADAASSRTQQHTSHH